jgi:signal transduction histidine kinase
MLFKKLINKIIGDDKRFSLEHRIFNISAFSAVLMSIQASFTDSLQNQFNTVLYVEFFGLLFFSAIYLYSRKKRIYKTPALISFIFIIFIYIPSIWISGGGLFGAFQIYLLIFTFVITSVFKRSARIPFLVLLIVVSMFLVWIEYKKPFDIFTIPEHNERYIDYLINIPIAIVYMSLLTFFIYKQYKEVTHRLASSNDALEDRNREIISQKDELESALNILKKTQNQLIESEKNASLSLLTAGIAHELNTPIGISVQSLTGIGDRTKQISEELKQESLTTEKLIKYLEFTYQSSNISFKNLQRAGELISTFKQISEEQAEHEKREFLVKPYFKDVIFSLKSNFEPKNVRIKLECDESITFVGVPSNFAQILTNLIMNSLIHGFSDAQQGQILISVEKSESGLHIKYQDNGKGMKKELLSKIYDPFFTTDKKCGTGLGMHIVWNTVTQKLKGTIRIETDQGDGFTCHIQIP